MKLDPFCPNPFFEPGSMLCHVKNELAQGDAMGGISRPIRSLEEVLRGIPAPQKQTVPPPVNNTFAKMVYKVSGAVTAVCLIPVMLFGLNNSTVGNVGIFSMIIFFFSVRSAYAHETPPSPPVAHNPILYMEYRNLKEKWEEAVDCANRLYQDYTILSVVQDPELYALWLKNRALLEVLVSQLMPTWFSLWPDGIIITYADQQKVSQEELDSFSLKQGTSTLQEGLRIVEGLKIFLNDLPAQISQEGLSLRGRGGVRICFKDSKDRAYEVAINTGTHGQQDKKKKT